MTITATPNGVGIPGYGTASRPSMAKVDASTIRFMFGHRRFTLPVLDIDGVNSTVYNGTQTADEVIADILSGLTTAGFTPEYQAILDFATAQGFTLPSAATQTAHDTFVASLKAASLWNRFDLLNIYYGDMTSDFARINWANPVVGALATLVNSPTYTNMRGFNSNGSSSYILTGFNPSAGTNYTLNDAACGFFGYNDVASNRIFGSASAGGQILITGNTGAAAQARINSLTTSSFTVSSNDGLIGGSRTDANTVSLYRNATALGSDPANASTVLPTTLMVLSSGSGFAPNTWQVQASFAGSSALYSDGGTAMSSAFNTLMSTSL